MVFSGGGMGGVLYVMVKVVLEGFMWVLVCEFGLWEIMVNVVVLGFIVGMLFYVVFILELV